MARIKGANSDYQYSAQANGIIEMQPLPKELYVRIFLCPYNMPSEIEPPHDGKVCTGHSATCPHGPESPGHTLIFMHQHEGIRLATDKGELHLDQAGVLNLKGRAAISQDLAITGTTQIEGGLTIRERAEISGELRVTPPAADSPALAVTAGGVTLRCNGATVAVDAQGTITLTPAKDRQVQIAGAAAVSGALSGPTITRLEETIARLEARVTELSTALARLTKPPAQ